MFYSQIILAKKGPLGKIWLAAHWSEKLTKTQIFSTSIKTSVGSIVSPVVPLALRVSGHLLLGVVRIYNRKVKYLFTDCNDALSKMKLAFRVEGELDLPEKAFEASAAAVNIANFGNFGPDDAPFEDNMIEQWALLALRASDRNTIARAGDMDIQDVSRSVGEGEDADRFDDFDGDRAAPGTLKRGREDMLSSDPSSYKAINIAAASRDRGKWLAFDEDDNELPEMLRNARESEGGMPLERDSAIVDDPEALRRKSIGGVRDSGVGRVSLESDNNMGGGGMSMEVEDMGHGDDLNLSMGGAGGGDMTMMGGSRMSDLQLSPATERGLSSPVPVTRPVARRRKRQKICQADEVTKIPASERRKRASTVLTRPAFQETRRRRLDPLFGGEKRSISVNILPSFSSSTAPALSRFVAIMCSEGALVSRFGPRAGLVAGLPSSPLTPLRRSSADASFAGEDDFPEIEDDHDISLAPSDAHESVHAFEEEDVENREDADTARGESEGASSWGGISVHKSTKRVLEKLEPTLQNGESVLDFQSTLRGATRKEAATNFFQLLVLATKHDLVTLGQEKPYGAIEVGATRRFQNVAASM